MRGGRSASLALRYVAAYGWPFGIPAKGRRFLLHSSNYHRAAPIAAAVAIALGLAPAARAQTWTPLVNAPTFYPGSALLLTDGTVMVQDQGSSGAGTSNWWKLTPDNTGSYVNGTWTQLASLQS